MKSYRCLILDLDGTVLDSHAYTFAAFRYACGPYRAAPADSEIAAAFGPDENVILRGLVGDLQAPAAYARLLAYYAAHVRDVGLAAEMRHLLDDCAARGLRLGLFTGRGWEPTRLLLAALDLERRFHAVVAGDQARPKPAADGVLALLGALACAAEETLVVGDSPLDLEAASRAGTDAVLAAWYTPVGPEAPAAVRCLRHPDELRPLLHLPARDADRPVKR